MNKKTLSAIFFVLFVCVNTLAQTKQSSGCEVEQMAIDAALGNAVAQYNLGVRFYTGNGVPKDWSKAAYMWSKGIEGGELKAYNNLGYLNYTGGNNHPGNPQEGIRLWRIAAELGFAESQLFLGRAYSDGKVLPIDLIEAYAWTATAEYSIEKLGDENVTKKPLIEDIREKLEFLTERMTPQQIKAGEAKAETYIDKYGALDRK
jgi:TPR repeat protein